MKLARELSKRQTGKTLYLLDEPTTGLHFDDVRKLLEVLHRLTDLGNSVIIIEHNLDVIRNADWVIDLGPEGGEDGGRVVGEGRPAKIAATPGSYTGQFLKRYYKFSNGRLAPADAEEDLLSSSAAGNSLDRRRIERRRSRSGLQRRAPTASARDKKPSCGKLSKKDREETSMTDP